jgi:hypothetical protein
MQSNLEDAIEGNPGAFRMTVAATEDVHGDNRGPDSNGPDESRVSVKIGSKEYSLAAAEALCRRQAAGFYWIAGLSLINAIALAADWNFSLYLGLGVTQIVQVFAMVAVEPSMKAGFYVATLAVVALFGFLGWQARQIKRWPFVLGMLLYAADSVIFLAIQDVVAFAFHMFWLVFLWVGLRAVGPVQDARRRLPPDGGPRLRAGLGS